MVGGGISPERFGVLRSAPIKIFRNGIVTSQYNGPFNADGLVWDLLDEKALKVSSRSDAHCLKPYEWQG